MIKHRDLIIIFLVQAYSAAHMFFPFPDPDVPLWMRLVGFLTFLLSFFAFSFVVPYSMGKRRAFTSPEVNHD